MKKTLIALASVAALGAAHADVTLYGVIDAGFGTSSMGLGSDVNNPSNSNILAIGTQAAANSVAGRTTSMTNGMVQASRWGLKGSEDLGSGMKGMFTLESALNIAGGTNPNDHLLLATQSQSANGTASGGAAGLVGAGILSYLLLCRNLLFFRGLFHSSILFGLCEPILFGCP